MSERSTVAARRVALVVGGALLASAIVSIFVDPHMRGPGMGPGMAPGMAESTVFVQIRLFISTFNVLVILALTASYLRLYRDLPTRFTGSLLLFSLALFFYALSASPAVQLLFGFRGGTGLGPFTFLPDLFASVAVVVLLYQSYQ
ncbi:hypothetical protein [Halanaeroarchaeum sulfurireducens]|uniref:Uncharacterized protein n=1 Tax=Halanaeroarchaeum sulfurireducens TaxID=1604004 RepID=A0A0F7PG73_9EURY|nr:hypothetical protein [Halanaeroarchaeum sulfurireducens]AKH98293.1 hypothetical protein HLASF_1822 [Halanaeroarchaeum sulfurireducens]ALG82687.1 hypothetical protein HLASA_1808 [Halanaeroarchaeum sulfurireducens]